MAPPAAVPHDDNLTHYTVTYDSANHIQILTQMWGSKWREVLPYCLLNVAIMAVITMIDDKYHGRYTLEITKQGHTFITLIVAFLLVSRVNIALSRYNEARGCLEAMYRENRELIQNACVLSAVNTDERARSWRQELGYRCLILLRTTMAVIDYPVTHQPAWEIPELNGIEKEDIQKYSFQGDCRRWAHAKRTTIEESMRVPVRLAYLLRETIFSQSQRLAEPIQLSQENRLMVSVDGFMNGYYGMRRFLTTPVPFPLIQMARTFLFLYVFTVPFVMLSDDSSMLAHCFAIFVLTYGFVGLELVAIEMDNPFGDDPNDFNNAAMAQVAYEDTYLTILDVDGEEAADQLRARMYDPNESLPSTEQSWLLVNSTYHQSFT